MMDDFDSGELHPSKDISYQKAEPIDDSINIIHKTLSEENLFKDINGWPSLQQDWSETLAHIYQKVEYLFGCRFSSNYSSDVNRTMCAK